MIEFAGVSIDVEGHELRRDGQVVHVEPQVFAVLVYLIEHRERLVTKAELYDAVWGHRFVTESALTSRIKTARQLIGDTGRDQQVIRTVRGRGYRFVAELDVPAVGGDGEVVASGARSGGDAPAGAAALVERLAGGTGAAVQVDPRRGGVGLLDELLSHAARGGIPTGHGSARRSSLRTYGCLIDALDELLARRPDLLDPLAGPCRDELASVIGGAVPSRRQRFVLAVHDLVVAASRGGLVLVLDAIEHADADTIAVIEHLAGLTAHHALVLAVGVDGMPAPLRGFRLHHGTAPPAATGGAVALPDDVTDALALVSLLEPPFDIDVLAAALDATPERCLRLLDACDRIGALRAVAGRFALDVAGALPGVDRRAHRRAADHRLLADRLAGAGAEPARVAHHLIEGGDAQRAVPFVLHTARARQAAGLHREALGWIQRVLHEADGAQLSELHALRADALGALGDPAAAAAYRQALTFASAEHVPALRARLARAALWSGDLEAAAEVLHGLEPSGGPGDEDLLLVQGMLAYFNGDLDAAERAADQARALALAPGASPRLLDAVTLQGMIAHSRGRWSDRLLRELRNLDHAPEVASTVFDCHLCVAEYLLYGPAPYGEVVELARRLRRHAEALDARRAVAFAECVEGEALLLAGRLDEAAPLLERSVAKHRELGADTGLAHSLQRLAELQLGRGDRWGAEALAREALARARWSPLSHHLLQRVYGTLVAAADHPGDAGSDGTPALSVVDEAAQVLDEAECCHFCEVMFAVPAAIACARGGRTDQAERYVEAAARSAALWQGTAWPGAVAEATAALAEARGDGPGAAELLRRAARHFEQAGQPLDAARCRAAAGSSR